MLDLLAQQNDLITETAPVLEKTKHVEPPSPQVLKQYRHRITLKCFFVKVVTCIACKNCIEILSLQLLNIIVLDVGGIFIISLLM